MAFRTLKKGPANTLDPIAALTAFVLIGFIISAVIFSDNTKTPLKIADLPQYSFVNTQ